MAVMQLKAALLITGIAANRKLLKRFFSPGIMEWLWVLPAIRLILPQHIGIPVAAVRYHSDLAAILPEGYGRIKWIGFDILLTLLLINCIRFYIGARKKIALKNGKFSRWIQVHPCWLPYHIYTSAFVTAPMVYGLFLPKIILPGHSYSSVQYENILLHEWMHIRRWDLWKKAFMMVVVMLNWYNPACWLMLSLFNRDIELACDADVLRILHKEDHAVYASVLLDCYSRMNPSATLRTGFLGGILQERIDTIMKQKKMSYKARCCAAVLFGALFLTAFGKFSAQTETPDKVPDVIGKTFPEAEQILRESGYGYESHIEEVR